MSSSDQQAWERYLAREGEVADAYRRLEAESVSPDLDAAVLAKARDAVQPRKSWLRWGGPVALAASVLLAVTLVIESGPGGSLIPATVPQVTMMEAPVVADRATSTAATVETRSEPPVDQSMQSRALETVPAATPAQDAAALQRRPAPSPPRTQSAAPVAQERRARAEEPARRPLQRVVPLQSEPSAAMVAPPAVQADANVQQEEALRSSPERWLDYIRELRVQGATAAADAQWRAFRERYPQFAVDAADAARPQSH